MALRIEDYAIIGDGQTAALVGKDGSIDWLCFWRFDAPSCFSALLGTHENGRWLLAPKGATVCQRRRYVEGTLVLETDFETDEGAVTVIDAMPWRDGRRPHLVRIVIGRRGTVVMQTQLVLRFDYGSIVPWVRTIDGDLRALGGQDAVRLVTPVPLRGEGMTSVAEFTVNEGDRVPFVLSWHFSYEEPPPRLDPFEAVAKTTAWWKAWSSRSNAGGEWREPVERSLITLKALTDERTGGIVAAPTTSLPEEIGGVRNWDYRFCWVRDATFTLMALLAGGYTEEAAAWREWLLRAVAGSPSEIQIMYGLGGERRLAEQTIPWLSGFEGSSPVRVGNAASTQLQLDVFGELMDCMFQCQKNGLPPEASAWNAQRALMDVLESRWSEADEGIWEVRGGPKHFTHSKMMAWVAMDRAIRSVETLGLEGPVEKWRATRQKIFNEVCQKAFSSELGAFTQCYGSRDLDASLLMMPLVGFLPVTDPRVAGTIESIQRELMVGGFVKRYTGHGRIDGLPGGEGAFIPCTLWLADCLALSGRRDDARAILDRVLAIRNDVGLLSEEYDPSAKRFLGNFPQAFSHVALVNTALSLAAESSGIRPSRAPSPAAPVSVGGK